MQWDQDTITKGYSTNRKEMLEIKNKIEEKNFNSIEEDDDKATGSLTKSKMRKLKDRK